MNGVVDSLLVKILELENLAERELVEQRRRFHYSIEQKRIAFEAAVIVRHLELKTGILRFMRNSGVIKLLASPAIYVQIVPLVLLDVAVSLFQFIVFPVYGIRKVQRDDFIVIDRHHLAYLNIIEKLNCAFCGYANGILAYGREIAGRAEEHFCPIKHARRAGGQHRRYYGFAEYGDAEGFHRLDAEITERSRRGG